MGIPLELYTRYHELMIDNPDPSPSFHDLEFAVDWFQANQSKPYLTRYFLSRQSAFQDLRDTVKYGILNYNLDVEVALVYIHEIFSKVKQRLQNDWISFNQLIGKRDEEIDIFCLFNIVRYEIIKCPPIIGKGVRFARPQDDKWMVFVILFFHRINRMKDNMKGIDNVWSKALKILSTMGGYNRFKLDDFVKISYHFRHTEYTKFVAGLDMFLHYFKCPEWEQARYGSSGARFRNCSMMDLTNFLLRLLKVPRVEQFFAWIRTESVERDVKRISKDGDEIDFPFSYAPYAFDMGLIKNRSPYLFVTSPHLHLYYQTISCLLEPNQRAKYTKDFEYVDHSNIIINAALVAYVYKKYGTICDQPGGRTIADWCKHIDYHELSRFISERTAQINDPRKGTVGARLKSFAEEFANSLL